MKLYTLRTCLFLWIVACGLNNASAMELLSATESGEVLRKKLSPLKELMKTRLIQVNYENSRKFRLDLASWTYGVQQIVIDHYFDHLASQGVSDENKREIIVRAQVKAAGLLASVLDECIDELHTAMQNEEGISVV